MIDNTTAISYVNNMGGKTPKCNQITKELWTWCAQQDIWVTAVHIPGKENILADIRNLELREMIQNGSLIVRLSN